VAPTASNSESSKILAGLHSTLTLKPASRRALVVVGVTAGPSMSILRALRRVIYERSDTRELCSLSADVKSWPCRQVAGTDFRL
jgi:hypothetical protein